MATKLNKLFVFEQSAFATTAEASSALTDMIGRFTALNATISDKLKGIADDCLVKVFEGKGKAEGSAFVLQSLLTSTPWAIRRFIPAIRRYLDKAGLKLEGTALKSLRAPETITDKSTAEEYRAYLATLSFNDEEKEDTRTEEEKAKAAKAERAKIKKDWSGENGEKLFAQFVINASERLKDKNKAFANDLYLFACNYEAVKQMFATMAGEGTLNKKSPIEKKAKKAK